MGVHGEAAGPDFEKGVPVGQLADGATLNGHVGGAPILLSRRGEEYFAVSGACTHYGAALADGLIVGDSVHCPWHHACFNLRTGEALAAPAFDALQRWAVEIRSGLIFVRVKSDGETPRARAPVGEGKHFVIVGGGAAGFAAADMLRRRGFSGHITMFSADAAPPYDRPNLSKDYLAGTAAEEWIPLKGDDYYSERDIVLRLGVEISALKPSERAIVTASGDRVSYDKLLLATGATPIRLTGPGFDAANVYVLRTLAEARAIIAAAAQASSVAIIGSSFIGLEAAASLRARGLEVHVIAPEPIPMERVLGPEIGGFIRGVHEANGVRFHLGANAERFERNRVHLGNGEAVDADFVVLGVGVRPNTRLAADAGLRVDRGIVVDAQLRTSAPDIFAAGDIAQYPDPNTGQAQRIEHWVHAQRQGQLAALNMLGGERPFAAAPFFWTNHYQHAIRYVGAGAGWDSVSIEGAPQSGAFTARYRRGERLISVATLSRDRAALEVRTSMEAACG